MAFVLVPVAGVVALGIGWYYRHIQTTQREEKLAAAGPPDDNAYWGYQATAEEQEQQGFPGSAPMVQSAFSAQMHPQVHGPSPLGAGHSPQYQLYPEQIASATVTSNQSHMSRLQEENQRLTRALAEEMQRSAQLTWQQSQPSQSEMKLRQDVLSLNTALLDAEDQRAAEREQAEADRQRLEAEAAATASSSAAATAGGPQSVGPAEGKPERTPSAMEASAAASAAFEIAPDELELLEVVGEGGFGRVYRGRWRGGEVAVKKLFCNDSTLGDDLLTEFRVEVETLSVRP